MNLLNRLKLIRIRQGNFTQGELAERAGCTRQTIHSIEAQKFIPNVELSLRIARALGVKIEEIFSLADDRSKLKDKE